MLHQVGDGRADVDHQVGHLHERHHQFEQVTVVVEVAVAHQALTVQVGGKDARVLIDGAVLDDVDIALRDFNHLLEALVQEVNLQVERPACHVGIEVFQIGIVVHGLKTRAPPVVLGKQLGQGGLAAADVSCYCDMHILLCFRFSSC